jgi:NADPH2:quinone reductase
VADAIARLAGMVEAGTIRPQIGSVHPLEEGTAALRELDQRRATGKVVLTI